MVIILRMRLLVVLIDRALVQGAIVDRAASGPASDLITLTPPLGSAGKNFNVSRPSARAIYGGGEQGRACRKGSTR